MKHIFYLCLLILAGQASSGAFIEPSRELAANSSWQKHCYFGLSYQYYYIPPVHNLKSVFHKHYQGFNVYLGIAPVKLFAIEVGQSFNLVRKKENAYSIGTAPFDAALISNYSMGSKIRYKSYNLDARILIVDDYLLWVPVYGTLGIAFMHPKLTIQVQPDTSVNGIVNTGNLGTLNHASGKTRFIPRIGVGTQCMVTDSFGWRLDALLMQTSRVRLKYAGAFNSKRYVKDSFVMQLGAFINVGW